jgi:hypothetical protein
MIAELIEQLIRAAAIEAQAAGRIYVGRNWRVIAYRHPA